MQICYKSESSFVIYLENVILVNSGLQCGLTRTMNSLFNHATKRERFLLTKHFLLSHDMNSWLRDRFAYLQDASESSSRIRLITVMKDIRLIQREQTFFNGIKNEKKELL